MFLKAVCKDMEMNMGIVCKLQTCREWSAKALDPLEMVNPAGIVWCSTFEAHME